jgi:1-acyl-sn-glycerol-3-phosphate acyltransferase
MNLLQRIVLAVTGILVRCFISWEIRGRENIPAGGALLVISNHLHLLDPFLIALSFPRWVYFIAKEELFENPLLKPIIHWSGAVSAPRRGGVADKKKTALRAEKILAEGLTLCIFPEGKRSVNAGLLPGKFGPVVISAQVGAPFLPVGIIGTEKARGLSRPWRRPHAIINIGKPFELPCSDAGRLTRGQMKVMTDLAMRKIAELLPESYRGMYK